MLGWRFFVQNNLKRINYLHFISLLTVVSSLLPSVVFHLSECWSCSYRYVMMMRWSVWWLSPLSCRRSSGSLIWTRPGKFSQHIARPKRLRPNWRQERPPRKSDVITMFMSVSHQNNRAWNIYVNTNTNKLTWKKRSSGFLGFPFKPKFVDKPELYQSFIPNQVKFLTCSYIVMVFCFLSQIEVYHQGN